MKNNEDEASEPFLARWLKEPTLWVGAIITMVGIVLMAMLQPSVQWIMSHSISEYLQQMSIIVAIFALFVGLGMVFWGYSLYRVLKK